MEDLYSENQQDSILGDNQSFWQKMLRLLSSPAYELYMNILTLINISLVFVSALSNNPNDSFVRSWVITQIAVNTFMGLEMVSDLIVSGPIKAYKYHFRIWPETLCQILNVPAIVEYARAGDNLQNYNYTVKIFEVIVFIRMLKFCSLLYEIKVMRVIFET